MSGRALTPRVPAAALFCVTASGVIVFRQSYARARASGSARGIRRGGRSFTTEHLNTAINALAPRSPVARQVERDTRLQFVTFTLE